MEPHITQNSKLVFLGNSSVGKSCIVSRFVRGDFFDFQEPTIGAAFSTKIVDLDNKKVRFEIWDTAGQERYRSLAPMYYRGASAAIVVYDITNEESFNGAKSWVREIQRRGHPNCVISIVGNKSDLENLRKVETEDAIAYAESVGITSMEVSAKTAHNIKKMFIDIAEQLPEISTPSNKPLFAKIEESKSIFKVWLS